MTSRPARACLAAALTSAAGAALCACQHQWIPTGLLACGALVLVVLAAGREQHDHVLRVRHEQARRAAALDEQAFKQAPTPCCSFWQHSDGEIHGPGCTRPPYARYDDYRLDPSAAAAFEEISAHFDDQEAA